MEITAAFIISQAMSVLVAIACIVTEQLKAENQMLWVQRINNIRDRAMEFVNHDLIYA